VHVDGSARARARPPKRTPIAVRATNTDLGSRAIGVRAPGAKVASTLGLSLAAVTALIPIGFQFGLSQSIVMLTGLGLFAVVFALNASVHSYLVLAYSEADKVSLTVGFYYMANAAGRLIGTLLSGVLYQVGGVNAALWGAAVLATLAGIGAASLPRVDSAISLADAEADD
jgi:hypothetical protein